MKTQNRIRGQKIRRASMYIGAAVVAATMAFYLTACGGGGGGTASTPACNTPTGGCNTGPYNGLTGFSIPGVQPTNYGAYCGCGAGTYPIYNPSWGFACVSSSYFNSGGYYYGYSYSSVYNTGGVVGNTGITQVNYTPYQTGGQANCFSSFAEACQLNTTNSCPSGSTCTAISGNATIGVCGNGTNGGLGINNGYPNNGYPNGNYPGYGYPQNTIGGQTCGYYPQWTMYGVFYYYYCY